MILPSCWLILQIDTNLVINLQHIVQQIVCFRCSMISPFQLVIIVLVTTSIGYISRNYVRIDIDIDIYISIGWFRHHNISHKWLLILLLIGLYNVQLYKSIQSNSGIPFMSITIQRNTMCRWKNIDTISHHSIIPLCH